MAANPYAGLTYHGTYNARGERTSWHMEATNDHAESRILKRAIAQYDASRARGTDEWLARQDAIGEVSRLSRIMWDTAAVRVADYLARRAERNTKPLEG